MYAKRITALLTVAIAGILAVTLAINYDSQHSKTWKRVDSMKRQRSEASVLEFQGDLFVFNGFGPKIKIENSVEKYDRKTGQWSIVSKTSVNDGTALTHNGLVKVGHEAWIIGGRIGDHPGPVTNKVWIFDLVNYQWRAGPELPQPGGGGGAALVDNKIYWFGGVDADANCDVSSHFFYDLNNKSAGWQDISTTAGMPNPRNHFSTVVLDKKIYAIGGQFGHDRCPNFPAIDTVLVHVFDPAKLTWKRLADLPFVQSHNEAGTFAHNGYIYSVGGEVSGHRVMRYDTLANAWTEVETLPQSLLGTVSRVVNGRILVASGGAPNTWNPTNKSYSAFLPRARSEPDALCPEPGKQDTPTSIETLTIQAESFTANDKSSSHHWEIQTSTKSNLIQSVVTVPNNGTLKHAITDSPMLSYQIPFKQAGKYYLWIRGLGDTNRQNEGKDDSLHVGINGTLSDYGKGISGFPAGDWHWSNGTRSGYSASIQVPSAGTHTVNIWMREDGLAIDQLVVTNNPEYNPSSTESDSSLYSIVQSKTKVDSSEIDSPSGEKATAPAWRLLHTGDNSRVEARHESGAVLVGKKIYFFGGRQGENVQAFDLEQMNWTNLGPAPVPFHHFQPVAINNMIYIAGAFTGRFPSETPVTHVYGYNTLDNTWSRVTEIPQDRLRGSASSVAYDEKIYLVGGNKNGHKGPSVNWFDVYDPESGEWSILPDAPHARDHAVAAIANDKLAVASGRQSAFPEIFAGVVLETDIYNFATSKWESFADDIPTGRAGSMVATVGNEVLVIGGESSSLQLAHDNVEALNIDTGLWREFPPLLIGRHGGGAVVANQQIHVLSGNASRGGGREVSCHEVYNLK